MTVNEATDIFNNELNATINTVVTFVGFSGAGYDDYTLFDYIVNNTLSTLDPIKTIINVGATGTRLLWCCRLRLYAKF